MPQTFIKDPDSVLDYTIDWEDWLGSDTIATSDWTVDTGLTEDSDTNTTKAATIWLSSGTANTDYEVTNEITTQGLRTDNRTITIQVREK